MLIEFVEMSDLSDDQIFEILLPLMDRRPGFRRELSLHLVEQLQRELQDDALLIRAKTPVKKNRPGDIAFAMFAKVRRLVILASKPHMREAEIEKQMDEEWLRLTESEKKKWQDLANADASNLVT